MPLVLFAALVVSDAAAQTVQRWPDPGELRSHWTNRPFSELERAAESGDRTAQHYLGVAHLRGERVAANFSLALVWLQRALDAGYVPSASNLGTMHERGQGTAKDPAKAMELYRRAAEAGVPQGQFNLALAYSKGLHGEPNPEEALKWFRLAADQQHTDAMVHIGGAYWTGGGVPRDYHEALKWFTRAANQTNSLAYLNLGRFYADATPLRDSDAAIRHLQKAAELGELDAYHSLYLAYRRGETDADEAQAVQWLTRAAEGGRPNAQCELGFYFENQIGREPYASAGVSNNMAEAIKWYRRSVDGGSAHGRFWLAECYFEGKGVEQNEERALELIREAADMRDPRAMVKLSEYYAQGIGEPRHINDRPFALLSRAAELDHRYAFAPLKQRYQDGRGTQRDLVKAAHWDLRIRVPKHLRGLTRERSFEEQLKDAVGTDPYTTTVAAYLKILLHRDPAATTQIAEMYLAGTNVPQDSVEALAWLQFAADHGVRVPSETTARVEATLSPDDKARAKQRSAELKRQIQRLLEEDPARDRN